MMQLAHMELAVAACKVGGASGKLTACILGIAPNTVDSYMKRVFRKYRANGDTCNGVVDLERLLARDYPPRFSRADAA